MKNKMVENLLENYKRKIKTAIKIQMTQKDHAVDFREKLENYCVMSD